MRIGTLAHFAGVTTKTVRFYERAGLLPEPPRTPSGYRDYPPQTADRLTFIRGAQGMGLSLSEIRAVLRVRDGVRGPCRHLGERLQARLGGMRAAGGEPGARQVLREVAGRAGAAPAACDASAAALCAALRDPEPAP